MFPDAYQPFALPSIMGSWSWLDPRVVDMGPFLRRRGLVFVDGKPLEPVEQQRELAAPRLQPFPDFTVPAQPQNGLPPRRRGGPIMQEVGGSPDARYWVETSGQAIQIRLASGTPADHVIEVTTRQAAFVPAQSGAGFIRIKGLTFQHAANAYPFPQFGMISCAGGDHWILEDNTIEWANGGGLSIGRDANSGASRQAGASHILRRNTIRYCGVEGIGGMGTSNTLIEENLIEWCGWADAERGWEAAGAKFHNARNLLFRRNVVRHMRHANAIWLDVGNANCRLTRNVFADVVSVSAAVHMEMTIETNQIDNNVIWDVAQRRAGHARSARLCRIGDLRQCHRQADRRAEPDRPLRQLRALCDHAARSPGKRHGDGQRHLEQYLREVRQVGHRVSESWQRGRWQRLRRHACSVPGLRRRRREAVC